MWPDKCYCNSQSNRPLVNGEAVTLQCFAEDPTGSGLSFQWFKDDLMISGQSSSALMLSAVGQNETGRYTCQVSCRLGTREVMFDHFLSIQGAYNTPYSHVYKICGLMKPYIHQRCYVCNNQLLYTYSVLTHTFSAYLSVQEQMMTAR